MSAALDFYLGTHEIAWLSRPEMSQVPLFISHRRLMRQQSWRPATTRWALDSGGFTELGMYGGWKTTPQTYVKHVRRFADEIGRMDWASPQDWMCEPVMLRKTGKTIDEHQQLTVDNYLELRTIDATLPFIPALQGFTIEDYLRCIDLYEAAGIDLAALPRVGVGSVCRRQGSQEITDLFAALSGQGLKLHGYGVKTLGLREGGQFLTSADSLAWSAGGRRRGVGADRATAECTHRTCANCMAWALQWRARLLAKAPAITSHSTIRPIPSPRSPELACQEENHA